MRMSFSFDRYRDLGLLIARLGFGTVFFWYHGLPKLLAGPDGWERTGRAAGHLGITWGFEWFGLAAALVESAGGLLFASGLLFRPACVALLCVMTVATIEQYSRATQSPSRSGAFQFYFAAPPARSD